MDSVSAFEVFIWWIPEALFCYLSEMFVSKVRSLTVEFMLNFSSDTLSVYVLSLIVGDASYITGQHFLVWKWHTCVCSSFLLFFFDSAAYFHCRQHLRDAFVRISFDISVRLCIVWYCCDLSTPQFPNFFFCRL